MPSSSTVRRLSPIDRHVAQRLHARREALGLRIERLAGMTGLSTECVRQAEQGEVRVSAEVLFKLSRAMSLSMKDLFAGLGEARGT